MLLNLIYFIGLIGLGFIFSLPMFVYVSKNTLYEYKIKNDVWIYMWFFSLFCTSALYFILPDFKDMIYDLEYGKIVAVFALAAFIYIAFLLENKLLMYMVMALSSAIVTFLVPDNVSIFEGYIPLWSERLIVFASVFFITFFAKILNGLPAIFAIFILSGLFGMMCLSGFGGVPLLFGIFAALLGGMWLGFLRFNWYPSEIVLNEGACASAGFLLSGFLLLGTIELSGSSILVLLSYLFAEIIWVLIRSYLWRIKEPDLYNNTAYFVCYTKDISLDAILVSVVKIGIINIIFSCFQLYAPNPFSMPIFTLVVNLWLLNMLYHASENNLSFRETNEAFVDDVKKGLSTVKEAFKRRK